MATMNARGRAQAKIGFIGFVFVADSTHSVERWMKKVFRRRMILIMTRVRKYHPIKYTP